jgi:hypothetical protein
MAGDTPAGCPLHRAGDRRRGRRTSYRTRRSQEDSVFFKSYIPRTLNEVYDPERDLEAVKKGGKTIYSDTIGIVNPKPEATTLRVEEDESIEGAEKPKVHFSTGTELEDETQDVGEGEEEEATTRMRIARMKRVRTRASLGRRNLGVTDMRIRKPKR